MIEEAYEKHHASLCRPQEETIPFDQDLSTKLRAHSRKFFQTCCHYDPFTTSLPNGCSSLEANRQEGGNLQGLINNGTIQRITRHPLLGMMEKSENPRMEPYVIGLFGPPGSGKSTMVQKLVSDLRRSICPGLTREDFVYARSCTSDHWDGYAGQPIVVLDDFG